MQWFIHCCGSLQRETTVDNFLKANTIIVNTEKIVIVYLSSDTTTESSTDFPPVYFIFRKTVKQLNR